VEEVPLTFFEKKVRDGMQMEVPLFWEEWEVDRIIGYVYCKEIFFVYSSPQTCYLIISI